MFAGQRAACFELGEQDVLLQIRSAKYSPIGGSVSVKNFDGVLLLEREARLSSSDEPGHSRRLFPNDHARGNNVWHRPFLVQNHTVRLSFSQLRLSFGLVELSHPFRKFTKYKQHKNLMLSIM